MSSASSGDAKTEDDHPQAVGMAEERCPICLDDFQDKAFITSCFHAYCFSCVVKAAEVSGNKCPMCKTEFNKVIHHIRAIDDYDTYLIPAPAVSGGHSAASVATRRQTMLDLEEAIRNFRGYRTTMGNSASRHSSSGGRGSSGRGSGASRWREGSEGRREGSEGRVVVHISVPGSSAGDTYVSTGQDRTRHRHHHHRGAADFGKNMRRSTRCLPASYRRAVYSTGVHALPLNEGRRGRGGRRTNDISAAYFKRSPARTHRLGPWLYREFEALLGVEDVEFMMQLVLSLIDKVDLESEYFASHLEPFLNERTAHFMHEFISFAKSPYDVIAYDGKVRYNWPEGYQVPVGRDSSSSRNSATAGPGPSSSSGDFQQRLFHELVEDPDQSSLIFRNESTSASSPIIIHGSDSESDQDHRDEVDVVEVEEDNRQSDHTQLAIGDGSNVGQSIRVDGLISIKDEPTADRNHSVAGTSTSADSASSSKPADRQEESISLSDTEPGAIRGAHSVSSKGKSKLGSDGTRVKKSLPHARKSSHKKKHHKKHHRRSRSSERHDLSSGEEGERGRWKGRDGNSHRRSRSSDRHDLSSTEAEEGERGHRDGKSRNTSLSPPREKRHKSRRKCHHKVYRTSEKLDDRNLEDDDTCSPIITGSSEELLKEARAIDEEIKANKREILKSALKKERIQLLHRNIHGSELQGKEEDGLEERGVASQSGRVCTDVMLRNELDMLNEQIRTKKKQLCETYGRQTDSD